MRLKNGPDFQSLSIILRTKCPLLHIYKSLMCFFTLRAINKLSLHKITLKKRKNKTQAKLSRSLNPRQNRCFYFSCKIINNKLKRTTNTDMGDKIVCATLHRIGLSAMIFPYMCDMVFVDDDNNKYRYLHTYLTISKTVRSEIA